MQALEDGLSALLEFLPKLLGFLAILVIGYFVAKILAKVIAKVLQKVGFDRAVEKGGIKKVLDKSQYDASDILAKIVFYAVMLFVLSLAFGVFGTNPISTYLSAIIGYLPKVFVAILIVVIAAAIAAAVKLLIQNTLGGLSYGKILANVASAVILALGVIAALNQLQIAQNVVNAVLYASLAALVGVVIVAVGGGGITPMRARWERTLSRYDEEKPKLAEQARNAPSIKEQAADARDKAQVAYAGPAGGSSTDTVAPQQRPQVAAEQQFAPEPQQQYSTQPQFGQPPYGQQEPARQYDPPTQQYGQEQYGQEQYRQEQYGQEQQGQEQQGQEQQGQEQQGQEQYGQEQPGHRGEGGDPAPGQSPYGQLQERLEPPHGPHGQQSADPPPPPPPYDQDPPPRS